MRRFFDITLEVLMKLKHASSLAVCVCYLTLQMKLPKYISKYKDTKIITLKKLTQ